MKHLFFKTLWLLAAVFGVLPAKAYNVNVTPENNDDIKNWTDHVYKGADGSILGFYIDKYNNYASFRGCIGTGAVLEIPDEVTLVTKEGEVKGTYPVTEVGTSYDMVMQGVTEVYIPASVKKLYNVNKNVKILHLSDYIDPENAYESYLTHLDKCYVPIENYPQYIDNPDWVKYVLFLKEGHELDKLTLHITTPGTLAQTYLDLGKKWNEVNELTVTGNLNENDANAIKNFKQLTLLDLAGTDLDRLPKNFGGDAYGKNGSFHFLKEIRLPRLHYIGEWALGDTPKLKEISLPALDSLCYCGINCCGIEHIDLPDNLTYLESYALGGNRQLKHVTLPDGITELPYGVLQDCSSLESVKLPENLKKIGEDAFKNTALKSVKMPPYVDYIGVNAFYNCKDLSKVELNDKLRETGKSCFQKCLSLHEITFPATLENINRYPLDGCQNVTKIVSYAYTPPVHSKDYTLFYDVDLTPVRLYVPAPAVAAYRNAPGWEKFFTIESLDDISSYANIFCELDINDPKSFGQEATFILNWKDINSKKHIGKASYNSSQMLSLKDFLITQYYGYVKSVDYPENAIHPSLIVNGPMRADHVTAQLQFDDKRIWYFLCLPFDFKISEIEWNHEFEFTIRTYSGENRASRKGDTWINHTADDVIPAYQGFIVRCSKHYSTLNFKAVNNETKNQIFKSVSASVPIHEYASEFAHNRSWNLVGNPYPCHFDSRDMDFKAPFTLWNHYEKNYQAYSPVDDDYVIHPFEAFFIQAPNDAEALLFKAEGRQLVDTVRARPEAATLAAGIPSERRIINLVLASDQHQDRTRIVLNEEASLRYEIERDASKFMSESNVSPQLYTLEDGVKYAINERPFQDGSVALGLIIPQSGTYRIALKNHTATPVVLLDRKTNAEQNLNEGVYSFQASAGTFDDRFVLRFDEATAISQPEQEQPVVKVVNGKLSVNAPYAVYSPDGRLAGRAEAGETLTLPQGIYIVNCENKPYKIVIQ